MVTAAILLAGCTPSPVGTAGPLPESTSTASSTTTPNSPATTNAPTSNPATTRPTPDPAILTEHPQPVAPAPRPTGLLAELLEKPTAYPFAKPNQGFYDAAGMTIDITDHTMTARKRETGEIAWTLIDTVIQPDGQGGPCIAVNSDTQIVCQSPKGPGAGQYTGDYLTTITAATGKHTQVLLPKWYESAVQPIGPDLLVSRRIAGIPEADYINPKTGQKTRWAQYELARIDPITGAQVWARPIIAQELTGGNGSRHFFDLSVGAKFIRVDSAALPDAGPPREVTILIDPKTGETKYQLDGYWTGDGTTLIGSFDRSVGTGVARALLDGTILWAHPSATLLSALNNNRPDIVLATEVDGSLISIDPADGSIRWAVAHPGNASSFYQAVGDLLVMSSPQGYLVLDLETGQLIRSAEEFLGETASQAILADGPDLLALGKSTGVINWSIPVTDFDPMLTGSAAQAIFAVGGGLYVLDTPVPKIIGPRN